LNPAADSALYISEKNPINQSRFYISPTLEKDLRFKRFFEFEDIREKADWKNLILSYLPNTNILTSTHMLNNFDPMLPDRFLGYTAEVESASQAARQRLLALANVGNEATADSDMSLSISWDPINAYPTAWMAGCVNYVKDEKEALAWLKNAANEDTLRDVIAIETSDETMQECTPDKSKPQVNVISKRSTRLEYRISGNGTKGYLFLANTWYPGWVAYVDGRETPVNRADYVFMAVKVPAGDHSVLLEYRPASLIVGAWLTLAGIFFCVILGVWHKTSRGGLR